MGQQPCLSNVVEYFSEMLLHFSFIASWTESSVPSLSESFVTSLSWHFCCIFVWKILRIYLCRRVSLHLCWKLLLHPCCKVFVESLSNVLVVLCIFPVYFPYIFFVIPCIYWYFLVFSQYFPGMIPGWGIWLGQPQDLLFHGAKFLPRRLSRAAP